MKLKFVAALCFGLLATQVYADQTYQTTAPTNSSATQMDAKKAGEMFLLTNKKKPGVVTLADGLQYKILKAGTGPKPTDNDTVSVEYAGKLVNGTEFDSSDQHGGPASFGVSQVIPGWTEALKLMPEGSSWEIYVPSNLAYGDQGAPPVIGPNEALIFKVTLLKVQK